MSVCGDLEREAATSATCGTRSRVGCAGSRGAWAASRSAALPAALPARSARLARSAPLLAPSRVSAAPSGPRAVPAAAVQGSPEGPGRGALAGLWRWAQSVASSGARTAFLWSAEDR